MLKPDTKVAIFLEGALGLPDGKMGYGVLRYSPNPVAAIIDSTKAGRNLGEFIQCERQCPIVRDMAEAKALGAEAVILGIAPLGGHIPEYWLDALDKAVSLGLSIVNGLHDTIAPRYRQLMPSQWIWDIRQEPKSLPTAAGKARFLNNKRILFVGSDMSVGKMTAALELHKAAQAAHINSQFLATGQTGITISGSGIPLDAIRLDYACGAVEQAVMSMQNADMIIIEGQGSLAHPSSTATLPLLRGSCPTHLVFCHRAGQSHLVKAPDIQIPPLPEFMQLYESVASVCGTYSRPKTTGICLNTGHLDAAAARKAIDQVNSETGLPAWDVVREGGKGLLNAILASDVPDLPLAKDKAV